MKAASWAKAAALLSRPAKVVLMPPFDLVHTDICEMGVRNSVGLSIWF